MNGCPRGFLFVSFFQECYLVEEYCGVDICKRQLIGTFIEFDGKGVGRMYRYPVVSVQGGAHEDAAICAVDAQCSHCSLTGSIGVADVDEIFTFLGRIGIECYACIVASRKLDVFSGCLTVFYKMQRCAPWRD